MSDDDDFLPAPTHRHCAKCNRVLPTDAFKRFMTPAEMRYRGYSGNRKVLIETKHCKDCRPRRRVSPESFKTHELKQKAARGEISPVIANAIEKVRTEKARARMRSAATARWDKVKLAAYDALLDGLREEILAVTQQRKHARHRPGAGTTPANTTQAILTYCDTYLTVLRRLRADLTLAARRLDFKVEHENWQGYLTHEERQTVAQAWAGIEPNKAASMRAPAALAVDRFS